VKKEKAMIKRGMISIALSACLLAMTAPVKAENTKLRVNIFAEAQNLALFVAQDEGMFARRQLDAEVTFTPTSSAQRQGLVNGSFDIAQAGVDNAVALVQTARQDVVIVAGGGNGGNHLFVRPEIGSYQDLRGKAVVVDAPNTAYAFLAYKMLELKGLHKDQDYAVAPVGGCVKRLPAMQSDPHNAAAMLNPPCSLMAARDGFHDFGPAVDVVGPYQADGIWVMRPWAAAHQDILVRYLQSVIEGYRWAADPTHRQEAASILARHLNIVPDLASGAVEAAIGPQGSLAKDLRFDMDGFRNTLKLRAEFAAGEKDADPARYIDLNYYNRALAGL
jgi:ABC-type nitrate/sulfonate/bicarbonate transport system substrate-binding protein